MKIAIVISSQHSIPHGGVGQFCKVMSDLFIEHGHEVHFLFDKKPRNSFLFSTGHRHFYNLDPLKTEPSEDRHKQGIDKAKIENFRRILETTEHEEYDLYLVNTSEAFDSITQFNTDKNVILYTHLFNQIFPEQSGKSVFTDEFVEHFNKFLITKYTVGTQSEFSKQRLEQRGTENCLVLPMPMTETQLLEDSSDIEKSGVLFVGTHSPGKNPSQYIKTMAKLKLPCKVMTSSKGKIKFEENFKKHGITDYDIRVGITGQEKVDFIKSCKLFFNTSLFECYSFATFECMGHMPIVVLDKQIWSDNFDSRFIHKTSSRKAHELVQELYNTKQDPEAIKHINELHNRAIDAWTSLNTKRN